MTTLKTMAVLGVCLALGPAACLSEEFPDVDPDGDGFDEAWGDNDCDPHDGTIYPGAPDSYGDGVDQDCDECASGTGDGVDRDCDGYPANDELSEADVYDCDDQDPDIHPGAVELCDGIDNDCSGDTPEDEDLDGDGLTLCQGDCDDGNERVSRITVEICDTVDNDCDGVVDEECVDCTVFVPDDATTVAEGMEGLLTGDTVCVEPGVYAEGLEITGAPPKLLGIAGPSVTFLDGTNTTTVLWVYDVDLSPGLRIEGFTVINGKHMAMAGGLDVDNSIVELRNVSFLQCHGAPRGAAICATETTLTVDNAVFADNILDIGGEGAALYAYHSDVNVSHAIFRGNDAAVGPAMYILVSSLVADHIQALGNSSSPAYGAITVTLSTATISHATVHGNSGGGIVARQESEVTLDHVVASGNSSGESGTAGIDASDDSSCVVLHSNVWDNYPSDYAGFDDPTGADGNLALDPSFMDVSGDDPAQWDLHLSLDSPLVDAGESGMQEPDGSPWDLGAFGSSDARGWDLDGDGAPSWWQAGPYDTTEYPGLGLDCNDWDATVHDAFGCDGGRDR